MKRVFLAIAALTTTGLATVTRAADTPLTKEEQLYFDVLDVNRDGKIDNSELNKVTSLIFRMADMNGDGGVSKEEIKNLKDIIEAIRKLH